MEDKRGIQLNKYLAHAGISSRRRIAELVEQKRITVNGKVIEKMGLRIDPGQDVVLMDGKKVKNEQRLVYIMLYKPKGIISTASDEKGRKTVVDLVRVPERIYPVGRLDEDSTGLILLTNDGELANFLTHPRYEIPKTYEVAVTGAVTEGRLDRLRRGIRLKEGQTAPAEVRILNKQPKQTLLEVTIHEGYNHQIRRMCGVVGLTVVALKRVSIGSLGLGSLKYGESRPLQEHEIEKLKGG